MNENKRNLKTKRNLEVFDERCFNYLASSVIQLKMSLHIMSKNSGQKFWQIISTLYNIGDGETVPTPIIR